MTLNVPYNHEVLALIDAQRKLGWPDFGPEKYCHRCGGVNVPSWFVDSDRFNAALGPYAAQKYNGIVCPGCFVELHEIATGLTTTWTLTPWSQVNFRPIDDSAP